MATEQFWNDCVSLKTVFEICIFQIYLTHLYKRNMHFHLIGGYFCPLRTSKHRCLHDYAFTCVCLQSNPVKTFLVWLNHKGTVWWIEDETCTDLSLHLPLLPILAPSFLTPACVVCCLWAAFDSHNHVPHPRIQSVISLPFPLKYTSLLQHGDSRSFFTPTACMNLIMASGHHPETFETSHFYSKLV